MSCSQLHNVLRWTQGTHTIKTLPSSSLMKTCCACFTTQTPSANKYDDQQHNRSLRRADEFEVPSPYKNPGPRRFGFNSNYKTQGCLPRDGKPVNNMPPHRAVDRWDKKASMFGQNDYIDILGDGDVHPSDLLTGPSWLLAFKGNERERLLRKMEWQGARTKVLYPAEFNRMEKRIRYLTKVYNNRRHMRKKD